MRVLEYAYDIFLAPQFLEILGLFPFPVSYLPSSQSKKLASHCCGIQILGGHQSKLTTHVIRLRHFWYLMRDGSPFTNLDVESIQDFIGHLPGYCDIPGLFQDNLYGGLYNPETLHLGLRPVVPKQAL